MADGRSCKRCSCGQCEPKSLPLLNAKALVSNPTFITTVANNPEFIAELTSNAQFVADILEITSGNAEMRPQNTFKVSPSWAPPIAAGDSWHFTDIQAAIDAAALVATASAPAVVLIFPGVYTSTGALAYRGNETKQSRDQRKSERRKTTLGKLCGAGANSRGQQMTAGSKIGAGCTRDALSDYKMRARAATLDPKVVVACGLAQTAQLERIRESKATAVASTITLAPFVTLQGVGYPGIIVEQNILFQPMAPNSWTALQSLVIGSPSGLGTAAFDYVGGAFGGGALRMDEVDLYNLSLVATSGSFDDMIIWSNGELDLVDISLMGMLLVQQDLQWNPVTALSLTQSFLLSIACVDLVSGPVVLDSNSQYVSYQCLSSAARLALANTSSLIVNGGQFVSPGVNVINDGCTIWASASTLDLAGSGLTAMIDSATLTLNNCLVNLDSLLAIGTGPARPMVTMRNCEIVMNGVLTLGDADWIAEGNSFTMTPVLGMHTASPSHTDSSMSLAISMENASQAHRVQTLSPGDQALQLMNGTIANVSDNAWNIFGLHVATGSTLNLSCQRIVNARAVVIDTAATVTFSDTRCTAVDGGAPSANDFTIADSVSVTFQRCTLSLYTLPDFGGSATISIGEEAQVTMRNTEMAAPLLIVAGDGTSTQASFDVRQSSIRANAYRLSGATFSGSGTSLTLDTAWTITGASTVAFTGLDSALGNANAADPVSLRIDDGSKVTLRGGSMRLQRSASATGPSILITGTGTVADLHNLPVQLDLDIATSLTVDVDAALTLHNCELQAGTIDFTNGATIKSYNAPLISMSLNVLNGSAVHLNGSPVANNLTQVTNASTVNCTSSSFSTVSLLVGIGFVPVSQMTFDDSSLLVSDGIRLSAGTLIGTASRMNADFILMQALPAATIQWESGSFTSRRISVLNSSLILRNLRLTNADYMEVRTGSSFTTDNVSYEAPLTLNIVEGGTWACNNSQIRQIKPQSTLTITSTIPIGVGPSIVTMMNTLLRMSRVSMGALSTLNPPSLYMSSSQLYCDIGGFVVDNGATAYLANVAYNDNMLAQGGSIGNGGVARSQLVVANAPVGGLPTPFSPKYPLGFAPTPIWSSATAGVAVTCDQNEYSVTGPATATANIEFALTNIPIDA